MRHGSILTAALWAVAILVVGGTASFTVRDSAGFTLVERIKIKRNIAALAASAPAETAASTVEPPRETEEPNTDSLDEPAAENAASPAWKDHYGQLETALKLVGRPASDLAKLGEPTQEKYLPLGLRLADGYLSYRWLFTQAIGDQYSGYDKTIEIRAAVNKVTKTVDAVSVDLSCDHHFGRPEPYTRPTLLEVASVILPGGENSPSSQRHRNDGKYRGMVMVDYRPQGLYIQADYLDGSPVKRVTKTDFATGGVVERVVWRPDFSFERTRVKRAYYCPGEATGKRAFLTNEGAGYSLVGD